MKTRRIIKGTSTGGILEQAYTPSNPPSSVTSATRASNLVHSAGGVVNPDGRGNNNPVGEFSTAVGYDTVASADSSTALGYNASATREGALAIGRLSEAYGDYAIAFGASAIAGGDNTTALGVGAKVYSSDSWTIQLGSSVSLSALRCKVNLTVTSDERDKTDINNITEALRFIDKLNPITFVNNDRENYISDADRKSENFRKYGMCEYDRIAHATGTKKGERRRCGLLAQEVIAAMQEVYGTDNYANIVNDNFHDLKEKPSDVENKYTLAYANLVPFLIGAIKELNAKIKELEGK